MRARSYKRFAILGGDGVFGVHMAKLLLSESTTERVISIGRNTRKDSAFTLGVGNQDLRFSYFQFHLVHDLELLIDKLDEVKPECIINFAGIAYATSWENSYHYYNTNLLALAKITEILLTKNYFKHWMQIGSAEVYGSASKKPSKELDLPNPTSPYAVSKLAADLHLKTYFNAREFPMNIIRPCNSYGPGQPLYRVIPKAILLGLNNEVFPLEGGGRVLKTYMHAKDMAEAIYLIIREAPLGEIYNAGTNEIWSIRDIVEKIGFLLKLNSKKFIKEVEGRSTEDFKYWLDSTKLKSELNWEPKISLDQGLLEMISWIMANKEYLNSCSRDFQLRS